MSQLHHTLSYIVFFLPLAQLCHGGGDTATLRPPCPPLRLVIHAGFMTGKVVLEMFFLVADDNTSRTNHLSFFYSSSPEPPTIEAALTTKRAARRQPILSRSKLPVKWTEVQLDEGVQMISLKKDNKNDVWRTIILISFRTLLVKLWYDRRWTPEKPPLQLISTRFWRLGTWFHTCNN